MLITRKMQLVLTWIGPPAWVTMIVVAVGLESAQSGPVEAGDEPPRTSNAAKLAVRESPVFAHDASAALHRLHDQIARIADQTLEPLEAGARSQRDSITQQIKTKSAEMDCENAKLTREVAEIGVIEYESGIFLQDKAVARGEIMLAESDRDRADGAIDSAKEQLAKIQKASKGSPQDLVNEYHAQDRIKEVEIRRNKAERPDRAGKIQTEAAARAHESAQDEGARGRCSQSPRRRAFDDGDLAARGGQPRKSKEVGAAGTSNGTRAAHHQPASAGAAD